MSKPEITAYVKTQCGWSNGIRAVLKKYDLPFNGEGYHPEPGLPLGDGAEERPTAQAHASRSMAS